MAPQYVQGGIFGGLDFQPLEGPQAPWGTTPATQPSISPVPGLPGSTLFTGPSSTGSAAQPSGVFPTGAPQGQVTPSAASSPPSASAGTSSAASGFLGLPSDWFYRAIVIILGFIFVALGLRMFGVSVPGARE